jgi:hypothetical protein
MKTSDVTKSKPLQRVSLALTSSSMIRSPAKDFVVDSLAALLNSLGYCSVERFDCFLTFPLCSYQKSIYLSNPMIMWQGIMLFFLVLLSSSVIFSSAWQSPLMTPSTTTFHQSRRVQAATPPTRSLTRLAVFTKEKTSGSTTTNNKNKDNKKKEEDVVETTEKYGLEAGLFQSLRREDGGETAKSLLQKYGIAYLATSIPLALISFVICYFLVDHGVDVAGLLKQVGIETTGTTETAGTVAIAYAAHKAASPIRFPPTVILTPLVARLIGKEPTEGDKENKA